MVKCIYNTLTKRCHPAGRGIRLENANDRGKTNGTGEKDGKTGQSRNGRLGAKEGRGNGNHVQLRNTCVYLSLWDRLGW